MFLDSFVRAEKRNNILPQTKSQSTLLSICYWHTRSIYSRAYIRMNYCKYIFINQFVFPQKTTFQFVYPQSHTRECINPFFFCFISKYNHFLKDLTNWPSFSTRTTLKWNWQMKILRNMRRNDNKLMWTIKVWSCQVVCCAVRKLLRITRYIISFVFTDHKAALNYLRDWPNPTADQARYIKYIYIYQNPCGSFQNKSGTKLN